MTLGDILRQHEGHCIQSEIRDGWIIVHDITCDAAWTGELVDLEPLT